MPEDNAKQLVMSLGDPILPADFWKRVVLLPEGCWEWTGTTRVSGIPRWSRGGIVSDAAKATYERIYGWLAAGTKLYATCLNRRCVNPAHLEVLPFGQYLSLMRADNGPMGKAWNSRACHASEQITWWVQAAWSEVQVRYPDATRDDTLHLGDPVLPSAFWEQVALLGIGCWEWKGAIKSASIEGCDVNPAKMAYEAAGKAIFRWDSLRCIHGNERCVNPAHQVVQSHRTGKEDVSIFGDTTPDHDRPHYCQNGVHLMSEENTVIKRSSNGHTYRLCQACLLANKRRHVEKKQAKKQPRSSRQPRCCALGHLLGGNNVYLEQLPNGMTLRFCLACHNMAEAARNNEARLAPEIQESRYCPRGHLMDQANTQTIHYRVNRTWQRCRICVRDQGASWSRRKREAQRRTLGAEGGER